MVYDASSEPVLFRRLTAPGRADKPAAERLHP